MNSEKPLSENLEYLQTSRRKDKQMEKESKVGSD